MCTAREPPVKGKATSKYPVPEAWNVEEHSLKAAGAGMAYSTLTQLPLIGG
jgi:hypothetical protein